MSSPLSEDHSSQNQLDWLARLPLLLMLAGALLLLVWFGLKAWRLAQVAQSLRQTQEQAESLTQHGLFNVDPESAEHLVMSLRRDVLVLDRELRPLVPVTSRLGWIPRVGPLLAQSEAFLDMADSGSKAAAYAIRGMKPALALLQAEQTIGEDLLPGLLPILEQAQPDLFAASASLDRLKSARDEIDRLEAFPWRVRTLLEQIDGKLYLTDELRLLAVAPALMGADGPQTYLIMAQNEDEIRATGGFLTGAGLLTVNQGEIVELSFQDANVVDDWRNKPYDLPPEPLYDLMALDMFLFRDANYWPDFPTSAEKAIELYQYGQAQAPTLDGAIAIDQQFVAMLLEVTGPLPVAELETTVSGSNVIANLREAWGAGEEETHAEWVNARKDFLGPLAQAIRVQLLNNFDGLDPLFLAETIHRAAQEKHLQIYVRDPVAAMVLDEIDWDGRLERPASGDHLMIVESNFGYNKVNPLIERSVQYDVELADDGSASAQLDIHFEHTGVESTVPCEQIVPYAEGITYDTLMNQCYWNYLRVYVPKGMNPVQLARHQLPSGAVPVGEGWHQEPTTENVDDGAGTMIATSFVLPRGETLTSTYVYQLPQVISGDALRHYRLEVKKQQGMKSQPITIRVTLPPGAIVERTSPPASVDGQEVVLELELRSDLDIEIFYR